MFSGSCSAIYCSEGCGFCLLGLYFLCFLFLFQIKSNDGLPEKICFNCAIQVGEVYSFKKKCEQSDADLRERFRIKLEHANDAKEFKNKDSENTEINIKQELVETIPDIQSDPDFYFPESDSSPESELDEDPEYETKLSKLKVEQELLKNVKRRYECNLCDKSFSENYRLQRHFKTNGHLELAKNLTPEQKLNEIHSTNVSRYHCDICNKSFNEKYNLQRHLKTNTHLELAKDIKPPEELNQIQDFPESDSSSDTEWGEDSESEMKLSKLKEEPLKHECKLCNKSFTKNSHLKRHFKTNVHIQLAQNITPGEELNQIQADINIKKEEGDGTKDKPKNNICELCGKNFVLSRSLKLHILSIHTEDKPHICKICGKGFPKGYKLRAHIKKHRTDPYECCICQTMVDSRPLLNEHLKTHIVEGDKPYACPTCGRTFKLLCNIKDHVIRHKTIKPFLCFSCGQTFPSNKDLNIHLRSHTGEKPYKCDQCPKAFARTSSLTKHKRVHTGERNYECDVCHKKFTSTSHVKRHKLTHTGERPYLCSYCPKNFTRREELVVHTRMHTGEQPFTCEICDHTFAVKSLLSRHQETHHQSESSLRTAVSSIQPAVPAPLPYQSIFNYPKSFS